MALTKVTGNEIDSTAAISAQSFIVSGVSTVGSLSIGNTSVINSAFQLQNIASLDATTTATIESAISNAPNTFSDLSVSGITTLGVTSATNLTIQQLNASGVGTIVTGNITTLSGNNTYYNVGVITSLTGTNLNYSGVSTFTNGPVLIGGGTSTGTASQPLQVTGGAYVSGNLGVGITSPTQQLQVVGNEVFPSKINAVGTVYKSGSFLNAFTTAGSNDLGFSGFIASQSLQTNRLYMGVHSPSGVNQSFIGTPDSNPLTFWTAATERVRIDSSGNLGIGIAPSYKLHVSGNASFNGSQSSPAYIYANGGGDDSSLFIKGGSTAGVWSQIEVTGNWNGSSQTGGKVAFYTAGTERVRIDSSGRVGIGTIAPNQSLDVRGNIQVGQTGENFLNIRSSPGNAQYLFLTESGVADRWLIGSAGGNGDLVFRSGAYNFSTGTERMRIDSSGNLGIGVTPSAWKSGARAIQFGPGAADGVLQAWGGETYLATNAYYGASNQWIYQTSGSSAISYQQTAGAHRWYIAPFGTAGAAVTFTQAMTLDASGFLGLGITPSARMDIKMSGSSRTDGLIIRRSSDNNHQLGLWTTSGEFYFDAVTGNPVAAGQIVFRRSLDSGSSFSESMRIDSSGNIKSSWLDGGFLGSYYSSTYYQGFTFGATARTLYIDNCANDTRADIVFRNGAAGTVTEKMRIDYNGNIGIGVAPSTTTANAARLNVVSSNNSAAVIEQVGGYYFAMRGKIVQSFSNATATPLFTASGISGNCGMMVEVVCRGVSAVSASMWKDTFTAWRLQVSGTYSNSGVSIATQLNAAGTHTSGTLSWTNVSTSTPTLNYTQGNNGYILESIDVYVTARDGAAITFNTSFQSFG
jgi:hypothetical protein